MVVVKNLSKVIKNKKEEKYILKNISFECPSKGMVLLYGNSGCGKTSLLNILEGLDFKYSGIVEILGKDLKHFKSYKYLKKDISIIFQDSNFINGYTVLENIKLLFWIKGILFDPFLIETRLKQFKIENIINKKIEFLSGGEKQILKLILTQLTPSKIVFCDEPTGSIDEKNEGFAVKLLKEMSKDRLVFVVSHNVELYSKFSDKLIYLKDGEIYDWCIIFNNKKTY